MWSTRRPSHDPPAGASLDCLAAPGDHGTLRKPTKPPGHQDGVWNLTGRGPKPQDRRGVAGAILDGLVRRRRTLAPVRREEGDGLFGEGTWMRAFLATCSVRRLYDAKLHVSFLRRGVGSIDISGRLWWRRRRGHFRDAGLGPDLSNRARGRHYQPRPRPPEPGRAHQDPS